MAKNLVAVITGASSGIGAGAARALAENNYSVSLAGRNVERLDAVAEQCAKLTGSEDKVLTTTGDLTDDGHLDALVQRTVEKFGRIDVLVNNAGAHFPTEGDTIEAEMKAYDKTMDINIKSVIKLTHRCEEHLVKTKGNIVNISSVAGKHVVIEGATWYCLSKAALNMYTRAMSLKLAPMGVRVNAICPGVIKTAMVEQAEPVGDVKMADVLVGAHPIGRLGHVEEIASMVLFLCDNTKAGFTTGALIDVDGGFGNNNAMYATMRDVTVGEMKH